MARLFDNAQNEYLGNVANPVAAAPYTMACWARFDVEGGVKAAGCLARNTGNYCANLREEVNGKIRWLVAAGGYSFCDTSTTITLNTWHHLCGVEIASNNRAVYLDGGGKGTDSGSRAPTFDRMEIGRMWYNATPYNYQSGDVADLAIWNVAFDDAEVAMLATGICPLLCRPGDLVAYWPLGGIYGRHDRDLVGGYDLTAYNTPSWSDHPTKVWYPNSGLVVPGIVGAPPPPTMFPSRRALLGVGV